MPKSAIPYKKDLLQCIDINFHSLSQHCQKKSPPDIEFNPPRHRGHSLLDYKGRSEYAKVRYSKTKKDTR